MKKIITFSREFGAGAGEIGIQVAKALGYEYYDREIILQTAQRINMNPEKIVKLDEKVPSILGFTQSLFDMYNAQLDEKLFNVQKQVIKQIAEKGNCVIVGRNANSILSEFDNVLNVFISAKTQWRIQHLKEDKMKDETEEKIAARIKEVDKARSKYCTYYTHTEFGNSDYYDICLSTSSLGIEKCVDLIVGLAKE